MWFVIARFKERVWDGGVSVGGAGGGGGANINPLLTDFNLSAPSQKRKVWIVQRNSHSQIPFWQHKEHFQESAQGLRNL